MLNLKHSSIIFPGPQINREIRNQAQAAGPRAHVVSQLCCSCCLLLENSPRWQRRSIHRVLWVAVAQCSNSDKIGCRHGCRARAPIPPQWRQKLELGQLTALPTVTVAEQQCKSTPSFCLLAGCGRQGVPQICKYFNFWNLEVVFHGKHSAVC